MGRPPKLFVQAGQRIGRGVVIDPEIRVRQGNTNRRGARLRCDCGNVYEAPLLSLVERSGRLGVSSCGCALSEHIVRVAYRGGAKPTHGMTQHYLYPTWVLMRQRCENPDNHKYPRYGGRGISVCDRWQDVRQFIEDIETELGPRPLHHTLDRIDNDGDYEPGNVQWSTPRQQARNQSRQGVSQFHGVQWLSGRQKWASRIHLGVFDTEQEAAEAYRLAIEVLEREGLL